MSSTSEFDALVAQLAEDPEKALSIDLTDEELLSLQKRLDPYARIAGPPRDEEQIRVAALSYTNMTEDYNVRFVTTGVIAFLWRMLSEWKVEPESRRWKPAKAPGDEQPFNLDEIDRKVKALQFIVDAAKEKEAAFVTARDIVKKRSDSMILSEEEMTQIRAFEVGDVKEGEDAGSGPARIQEMQELFKATRNAEDEYQGMLYTATLELRDAGLEADIRLVKTEALARSGPKGRAAIDAAPNRYRGILPSGQQEVPEKVAKSIIREFMSNYFEYDPDAHVRKAYDEVVIDLKRTDVAGLPNQVMVDPHDPTRIPLSTLLQEAPPTSDVPGDAAHLKAIVSPKSSDERQRNYNVMCHLLRDQHLAEAARYMLTPDSADPQKLQRWRLMMLPILAKDVIPVIPPQDTFHRLRFYLDANMEAIRAATEAIYHEKPFLDFAVNLMDYTTGTAEEVKEWGERFRDANQDRVISEIKLIEFGAWTWLGEFEKNRQIANIFNRHTDIFKRILDRHEEDKKLGGLLMRQRVKKAKAKNIREEGPDAPGLESYKESFPIAGAKPALSAVERKRLERTAGNEKAAKELEYYEQYEKRVHDLETRAKFGELSEAEKRDLQDCYVELEKSKQMLEVPDNAIQVDIWKVGADGKMRSEPMYTLASDVSGGQDDALSKANAEEALANHRRKTNPLDYYPTAESKELARRAYAEGKSAPELAPFAAELLQKELKRESDERVIVEGGSANSATAHNTGDLAADVDALIDSVIDQVASDGSALAAK